MTTSPQTQDVDPIAEILTELRTAAASVGTNLTALCTETGVPRGSVESWKKRPPRSLTNYVKLRRAIEKKRPGTPTPPTE